MKALVFDMDGTIANLYAVSGWLEDLRNESARPYEVAEPIYDMEMLNMLLDIFRNRGWKIIVTTWLAMNSTEEYKALVRKAKTEWLERYGFMYDEIHLIQYGRTKADATRKLGGFQVLIDDNEKIRKGWNLGTTINANENIIEQLVELLEREV